MPRGNDSEYAVDFDKRVQEQYGIHPNAQALIDAHRASRDPAVIRAGMTQVDPAATEEATADLEATAAKFDVPDNLELVDAAVRGNALVGVFLDSVTGVYEKRVAPWSDSYKPPVISQEEAEERAAYLREQHVRLETEKLRLEAEDKIAEARAAEEARIGEAIAQITADADAKLADAKAQAAQAAQDALAAKEEQERQDAQAAEDANAGQIAEATPPEPPDLTGVTPPLDMTTIGQVDTPPVDPSQVPPAEASDDDSAPETVDEGNGGAEIKATSAAIQAAEDAGIDIGSVEGTGKDGTITKADVDRAVAG